MTFSDDFAAMKRRQKAERRKLEAKYGRQALARLERLSRRDGFSYIDMPEKDFNDVLKAGQKATEAVADRQAAQYQDSRLKTRLDALSRVAGVDLAGLSLDDFNTAMRWLGPAITDAANRHKAASETSTENRNPFA